MNLKLDFPVLLFDGECNLCNSSVKFVLKFDKNKRLKFASLQSEFGRRLINEQELDLKKIDSIVYVDVQGYAIKSLAVFKTLKVMGGIWQYLYWLKYFPTKLADWFYDVVAKHRYRVFGKGECLIPTPEQKSRFIAL